MPTLTLLTVALALHAIAPALPASSTEPPVERSQQGPLPQRSNVDPDEHRWVPLFDGKTLEGWRGDPTFWTVEDGCIVGRATPENPCTTTTYLHHATPYRDFIIEFEIKLEGAGANSGLQYRSTPKPPDQGDGYDLSGYQADIDQRHAYTGILYETYGRGIAVGRGQRIRFEKDRSKREIEPARPDADLKKLLQKVDADPKTGGWHRYRVIADGRRLEHWIDGELFMVAEDHDPRFTPEGIFALQVHSGPPMVVKARNIRVRKLGPKKLPETVNP